MRTSGKKIGLLTIGLDRVVGVGGISGPERSRIKVDMRLDSRGIFHASYDGKDYEATTQQELHDRIKAAVDVSVALIWRRYIVVQYRASAMETDATGYRTISNTGYDFDLDESRAKLAGDMESHFNRDPKVIVGISLDWKVIEYTDPYSPPEDKVKSVRMKRSVYTRTERDDDGNQIGTREDTGSVNELDDDVLPVGCMLWTPAREEFLRQVRDAIGNLDARMVALFNGVGDELAQRIDLALTQRADRLLSAGTDDR